MDPTGAQVGEQLHGEEGIAYADLDLNDCVAPKQFHDVVGGYQRFDIFDLKVSRNRMGPENAFNRDDAHVEAADPPSGMVGTASSASSLPQGKTKTREVL